MKLGSSGGRERDTGNREIDHYCTYEKAFRSPKGLLDGKQAKKTVHAKCELQKGARNHKRGQSKMLNFTVEDHREDVYLVQRGRQYEDMGAVYYRNRQYQKAIECFGNSLEIAEKIGDRKSMGKALVNMGNAYHHDGKYQNSIDCLSKALEIAQETGDRAGEGNAFGNLGNAYYSNGQCQKAIDCYCKTLKIAEDIGCSKEVATALGIMGRVYESIGQYNKALEWHRKRLEIARENGDKEGVGHVWGNMGIVYHSISQYQKAIDCQLKHLEIAEEIGDRRGMGLAFGNLGNAYESTGQYQKAIDSHRKNVEIAEELGDKGGVGNAFGNMGTVYQRIGLYQKAIDCQRKRLEIAEEIGDRRGVENAYGNLGNAYHSICDYKKAIYSHRRALDLAEEVADRQGMGVSLGNLGNVYHSICQYQKAIDFHRKSLNIAEEIGDKQGVGESFGNIGTVYINIGQYKSAIDYHSKHLDIAEKIGDISGIAKAQSSLGFCYRDSNGGLACSLFAKSILSYQSIRNSLAHQDEFNTSMANTFALVHKFLSENLLNLNQVKAALLVSDSGKAKALNDLTRGGLDVVLDTASHDKKTFHAISEDPCSNTTDALFDETLTKVIHLMEDTSIISYTFDIQGHLHAWVVSRKGVFQKQLLTTNGLSAKTYLNTVNARLREILLPALPRNAIFTADVQTLQKVESDQFIKLAFTGEGKKKANNFTRDLEERVENLTRATVGSGVKKRKQEALDVNCVKEKYNLDCPEKSSEESQNDEEMCRALYSLDSPNITYTRQIPADTNLRINSNEEKETAIANYLRKQYSIFILPIEEYLVGSKIVIVPEGSLFKVPFCAFLNAKKEHLCDRYSLQFTPALHVLNASLLKPLPVLGAAMFVGNPKVGEVRFADEILPVPPLPNAAIEANDCSKYFGAVSLLEEKATKENVVRSMKDASIIHIAAHGHMDHADIFLAPNKGAPNPPSEEHYLLTAKDVLECTLNARLVVLSCCHSGRGPISAEGVVGIARSFLGAGARSVLATLWRIPDRETMEFMKLFYERVCQGHSVCAALQQATVELKKNYPMAAWAPFQIVGEDITLNLEDIEEIRRQSSLRKEAFQSDEDSALNNN